MRKNWERARFIAAEKPWQGNNQKHSEFRSRESGRETVSHRVGNIPIPYIGFWLLNFVCLLVNLSFVRLCAKIGELNPKQYDENGEVIKMKIAFIILLLLSSLGLIAAILLQSGRSAGLSGAIAGAGETFFGKKKGLDELLGKISAGLAFLFLLSSLVVSFMK